MKKELFTFIIGGKAGEGVKKTGSVASQIFINHGLHVFQMDDYMSLIRGGHNFSVVSAANRWISSHYMKADLVVNLDKRSYDKHLSHLVDGGIMVYNSDEQDEAEGIGLPITSEAKEFSNAQLMHGLAGLSALCAYLGFSKEDLSNVIKSEYSSGLDSNLLYAGKLFDIMSEKLDSTVEIEEGDKSRPIFTGNEALAIGAIASGLDAYYAYPMTPASTILHFLAKLAPDFGLAVIHPESELAVINMAIGSAFTGAKTMVGSSGGGIALMAEGISLTGISETPMLIVYSMRVGPATGVPTYTEQGDLNFALNIGHGEFLRIVAAPSSVTECFYLSAEMLDLVWKYQTPGIFLIDKHLSESAMTVDVNLKQTLWAEPAIHKGDDYKRYVITEDGVSPMLFPPSEELIKWNSYEHTELGITTEDPDIISKMHEKRAEKVESLKKYLRTINTVNVYGDDGPFIFTYGSTTMSVLEALRYGDINARVVQPVYLSPLPLWELNDYQGEEVITVEMSLEGQFTNLLKEKAGINSRETIKKYDGRPFEPIALAKRLKEVL